MTILHVYFMSVWLCVFLGNRSTVRAVVQGKKIIKAEYGYSSGQCAMFITINSILLNIAYLLGVISFKPLNNFVCVFSVGYPSNNIVYYRNIR